MKKLLLLCAFIICGLSIAQVSYSQDWTATGLNGWTSVAGGGANFSRITTAAQLCGSAGGTVRGEQYYGTSGQFVSPALTGNNQGQITLKFDYKITIFGNATTGAALADIGTITVDYASNTSGPWTTAYTINNTNHTVGATCTTRSINFSPNSGSLYVRFNVTSGSNADSYYYFDNVSVTQSAPPTCLVPASLLVGNTTTNSANISWTAPSSAPANGYQVYYSTTNTAPTTSTVLDATNSLNSTSTSATIPNLNPAVTYYVWVRSLCSATDQSSWAGSTAFTTPCTSTSIPYSQNFDSVTTPALPTCTNAVNSGAGNIWQTSTATGFTGNVLDYSYNSTSAANTWFFTQGINLTAGVSYRISYKYGNSPGSTQYPEKMKVAYGLSNNSASMTNLLKDYPVITGGTVTSDFVDFTPTTTGIYYMGFQAYSAADMNQLYVDDILVDLSPSCTSNPTGINATSITTNSAIINWTAATPAPTNGYEVYYSTSNVAPLSTVVLNSSNSATTNTNSVTLSLNPSTTYYVWVRGVCSSTSKGTWISGSNFTTSCSAITALPWAENFDAMSSSGLGSAIAPPCWSVVDGTKSWTSMNVSSTSYNAPKSTPNYMTLQYGTTNASQLWTPGFALVANTSYTFSFYYNTNGTSSSYIGFTGNVLVNGAQNSTGATDLGTFITDTQGTTVYTLYTVNYTPTTTGTYYFAINASSNGSPWYLGVDDFSLISNGPNLATIESTISKGNTKLYPNPFSDYVQISDFENVKSISVMDTSGKLVKTVDKVESRINLSELNTGMYVLVLTMKDGTKQSIKAIKK